MAKGINIESIISDGQLDKVLNFIEKMTVKGYEISKEKENNSKKFEEFHPEEAKRLCKEIDRIFELMEKTDPKEHEYYTLSNNYRNLLGILDKTVY